MPRVYLLIIKVPFPSFFGGSDSIILDFLREIKGAEKKVLKLYAVKKRMFFLCGRIAAVWRKPTKAKRNSFLFFAIIYS